jgi:serine phosphatase RsbU (regulator of sigma subunit)
VAFAALHLDETGQVECGLAGHPPLPPSAGLARHRVDRSLGPPLGVAPGFAFTTRTVTLEPDDVLAALPDGVIEVVNEKGEEPGFTGFAEALQAVPDRPLKEAHPPCSKRRDDSDLKRTIRRSSWCAGADHQRRARRGSSPEEQETDNILAVPHWR